MGISCDGETMPLSPLGEACLKTDLTAIHEILEALGYKDDGGAATEVCLSIIFLSSLVYACFLNFYNLFLFYRTNAVSVGVVLLLVRN